MELPDRIRLLQKVSYIEGMIRMAENYKDSTALRMIIRNPEMEDILLRHFYFSSGDEFFKAFTRGNEDFHVVLDAKFAGENILFHTRKNRDEHRLPFCHMTYCISGECVLIVRGRELSLTEGDTCLVAAGVPHSYYNLSEETITLHVVLSPAFVGSVLMPRLPQDNSSYAFFKGIVFGERDSREYVFVPSASQPNETTYALSSAFYYDLYRPPVYKETVNSYMVVFFTYLMRSVADDNSKTGVLSSPEQLQQQIKQYIATNCRTVTLHQLAEKFHFNESYLSQYLKKNLGETFTELLQSTRIALATKMLINTALSIVEIADRVGYQNMSYFYKLFVQVNHYTPAEYRARFIESSRRVIGHSDE